MTIDEFLTKLAETTSRMEWTIDKPHVGGYLRAACGLGCHCPVSAVANDLLFFGYPEKGGEKLGLSQFDCAAVINVADNRPGLDVALRARLLAAVGLQTETQDT